MDTCHRAELGLERWSGVEGTYGSAGLDGTTWSRVRLSDSLEEEGELQNGMLTIGC